MITVFVYGAKTNYLGDKASCPMRYFHFPGENWIMDIKQFRHETPPIFGLGNRVNFILGGGGVLRLKNFEAIKRISRLAKEYNGFSAIWSIGRNRKYKNSIQYPVGEIADAKCLESYDFVGARDFSVCTPYLPCSSCMIDSLQKHKNSFPKHKVVIYSHYLQRPILAQEDQAYPHINNMECDFSKADDHLSFIASGETVVTNSYHGAFWAMLMCRNVIVIPTSNRFEFFKYKPRMASYDNWMEVVIKPPTVAPGSYLEECRLLNTDFYELVMKNATEGIRTLNHRIDNPAL